MTLPIDAGPPATAGPLALMQSLHRLLDEAELGEGCNLEGALDEAEISHLVDVGLQRLEVGQAVAVAVEVAVGEETTFERCRRALQETGRDLRCLPVVRRVEIPAQRDHVVLQEIDQRGAVFLYERLARGPE